MSTELSLQPASSVEASRLDTLTAGWLVRRSMLWFIVMLLGITAACGLYSVASEAETAAGSGEATIIIGTIR